MEDSSTYQATIAKGRSEGREQGQSEEARNLSMRVATKRLGPPSAADAQTIAHIRNVAALESLVERVLEVESWGELFG